MLNTLIVDNLYRDLNSDKSGMVDQFNQFFRFELPNGNTKGIQAVAGFRPKSRHDIEKNDILSCAFCVIYTTYEEDDWPDDMDYSSGIFTYYGDNKEPGAAINDKKRVGNLFLEYLFKQLNNKLRQKIQPILCFEKVIIKNQGSFMRFLGLGAPGGEALSSEDELLPEWRSKNNKKFENYRAKFTILDEPVIQRSWLVDMVNGVPSYNSQHCPPLWKKWVETGQYFSISKTDTTS